MSTTTTYTGVRIVDMPDLGPVTDNSSVVGEHAGSGRFAATAFRDYVETAMQPEIDTALNTANTALNTANAALHNTGRNFLHNPLFNVAQRGAGLWSANAAYTADRWQILTSLDVVSVELGAIDDSLRAQIGDEAATTALLNYFTGNAGASAFNVIAQPIENVRRLAGKTVTVSFWGWTAGVSLKFGVSIDQLFGTGGAPSAAVAGGGASVTLTPATATRYSITLAVASVSGKTLGTNDDSYSRLNLWYSAGSASGASTGVAVQSGAIAIWGVQLEIGSVATPLEKPDPQQDLAKCQRFYRRIGSVNEGIRFDGYGAAGGTAAWTLSFPEMRAIPTTTIVGVWSGTNMSTPALLGASAGTVVLAGITQVTGGYSLFTNGPSTYIDLSADL